MLNTGVRSYLASKADSAAEVIYHDYAEGVPLEQVYSRILNCDIGRTGYFYGMNSKGVIIFHPDSFIVGMDLSKTDPVKYQLSVREGYYEYYWRNTTEKEARAKGLYMRYLPEIDLILTATGYRNEFINMIDFTEIENAMLSTISGSPVIPYILDSSGKILFHPNFNNKPEDEIISNEEFSTFINEVITKKDGFTSYSWRDSQNTSYREKIVYLKYVKDFDWIIGTSVYKSELNRNLGFVVMIDTLVVFIVATIIFIIIFKSNKLFEHEIMQLSGMLSDSLGKEDLSLRVKTGKLLEIAEFGNNLNHFMENLEIKSLQLSESIKEKDFLLSEIQHRVMNNLQTIISILNLQMLQESLSSETYSALAATQNRINAMAIVYTHLSVDNEQFKTDMVYIRSFMDDFISSAISLFKIDTGRIQIIKNIEDISLPRNETILCGLIINELISLIIKTTKDPDACRTIIISMAAMDEEGKCVLELSADCSSGMIVDSDAEALLEIELVNILSEQIGSLYDFEYTDFFRYKIELQC